MSKSLRRADTRASAERTADKPQREFLAKKWQRTKSRGIWILAGFLILLSIPLAAVVVRRERARNGRCHPSLCRARQRVGKKSRAGDGVVTALPYGES